MNPRYKTEIESASAEEGGRQAGRRRAIAHICHTICIIHSLVGYYVCVRRIVLAHILAILGNGMKTGLKGQKCLLVL